MIHNKFRYLLTLALLLTAATGAWAADTYTVTFSGFGNEACNKTITDATLEYSETFNVTDVYANYTMLGGVGGSNEYVSISKSQDETQITITVKSAFEGTVNVTVYYMNENWDESQSDISVTCVKSAPAITVEWNAATKTGTFDMPGSDVVLTPIYAPAAQWATEGNEVLTPKAAEGIVAGTDAPLIVEGTVAAGQGTVMYFATTEQLTAEQAAQANGWLSTLPTAANIADDGATVYVWYYIQGADTPDGETPTADNTFNDSEICTTPLTVTVRSNKFDLAFKAANANTIESGKATVTVGGTAATVTEGKLEGVKMGSEVKMTAKEGYKFRKVEVKKAAAAAPAKPEYADNAEELPANTKLYMRADLVYNGDWIWIPTYTAEQAQEVANYYAAITGTKCAVIYGHGAETDIYYVTSDNGVSGTVYRSNNLTDKFPGYKVYLLK